MGGFYGSIAIRTDDSATIRSTLGAIASSTKTRFLIAPPMEGWIAVYPSDSGQDQRISRRLARRLTVDMIHLISHHEDAFCYYLYRGGRLVDQFNSRPGYFAEVSPETRRKQRGRPERYLDLIGGGAIETVRDLLHHDHAEKKIFSSQLMADFARLLRLPHETVTSYDYLMDGETEGIQHWDEFIHVPDRSREIARKQREAERIEESTRRLLADRVLLVNRVGELPGGGFRTPLACPDRAGHGFLACLDAGRKGRTLAVERFGPPWSAGSVETGLTVDSGIGGLVPSPSGRYLLIQQGIPGWKTAVWDCDGGQVLEAASRDEYHDWVGFLPDESSWLGISADSVVVVPLDDRQPSTRYQLAVGRGGRVAAIHPTEPVLVVLGDENRLLLVYLKTGRVIVALLVGGISETTGLPALLRLSRSHADRAQSILAGMNMESLQQNMAEAKKDRLERYRTGGLNELLEAPAIDPTPFREVQEALASLELVPQFPGLSVSPPPGFAEAGAPARSRRSPMFIGAEAPFKLGFDTTGEWLFAATNKGVRTYRWAEVISGIGTTPAPVHSVTPAPYRDPDQPEGDAVPEIELKYDTRRGVPDLAYDTRRHRLLFATVGGQIGYLDLASGRDGVLIEPPGRPPILKLHLSRDGSKLCCSCHPDRMGRRRSNKKASIQVWDYEALAAPLDREEPRTES